MDCAQRCCILAAAICLTIATVIEARSASSDRAYPGNEASAATTGLFVYGDSTVDVGNNNDLPTMAKAIAPPYGRDFDTHSPTGRFCNGRLSVDYLTLYMQLPSYTLPFKQAGFVPLPRALNFASAGAGILNSSGDDLGERIFMATQVQNMVDVLAIQSNNFGVKQTNAILANAIHYISVGSNDFIHSYFSGTADVEFARNLTQNLADIIEKLYANGARKVAAVGIGPLGCAPHYLLLSGRCTESVNVSVQEFNSALEDTVASLATKHKDLNIVFCDVFLTMLPILRDPKAYGFRNSRMACCGAGIYKGAIMCMHPWMACKDANEFVWWDKFHPTDRVNELMAQEVWTGQACRPFNLKQLAAM